jgi:hypothetical protein
MIRNNIKKDISDLQLNVKAKVKAQEMGIFEKIELYTKTYESQEYKNFKEAVLNDPECDPTLYLEAVPYTKRELFNHLLDMELNYFPKLNGFVESGND